MCVLHCRLAGCPPSLYIPFLLAVLTVVVYLSCRWAQIEEFAFNFTADISGLGSVDSSSERTSKVSSGGKIRNWFTTSRSTATVSSQRTSASSEKMQDEFRMKVSVRAVQDEMPAGLARVMSALEHGILKQ